MDNSRQHNYSSSIPAGLTATARIMVLEEQEVIQLDSSVPLLLTSILTHPPITMR